MFRIGSVAAENNVIPLLYVHYPELKDVNKGEKDSTLEKFADAAVKFGEKFGGFFITPMWEMNIDRKHAPWSWCDRPGEFKKAWRRSWEIFEKRGANKYATWAIEYHVDFDTGGYWPGDRFVDWVGFSAYNRKVHEQYYGYRDLKDLISSKYRYFSKKYPDKPIMLAEFASTKGEDQPEWLRKAFETIESKPRIKAALYWDNVNGDLGDDHKLSKESLQTLKELLKRPYFL